MSTARFPEVQRTVAANVRRWRARRALTQEALAEEAGLALRHLQSVERGAENVTLATLVSIADALEIRPALLFRAAKLPPLRRGRPPAKKQRKAR